MRVLNANCGQAQHGVFTRRPEMLTTDFFVNLLDIATIWTAMPGADGLFEGGDRATDALKWTATRPDLVFGSSSQVRALAEVHACHDSSNRFIRDFVAA